MKDIRYCITCGLADPSKQKCQRTGAPIANPQTEYCSYHLKELSKCDWCGTPVIIPIIYSVPHDDNTEEQHLICHNCLQKSGLCLTCKHGAYCDFEESSSTLPKQVQKQIRQGNQIMITTVVNPDRIRETCQKNCKCFSEEFGCLRQNNQTCGEWAFGLSKAR